MHLHGGDAVGYLALVPGPGCDHEAWLALLGDIKAACPHSHIGIVPLDGTC